jgi:hypothetical protein
LNFTSLIESVIDFLHRLCGPGIARAQTAIDTYAKADENQNLPIGSLFFADAPQGKWARHDLFNEISTGEVTPSSTKRLRTSFVEIANGVGRGVGSWKA